MILLEYPEKQLLVATGRFMRRPEGEKVLVEFNARVNCNDTGWVLFPSICLLSGGWLYPPVSRNNKRGYYAHYSLPPVWARVILLTANEDPEALALGEGLFPLKAHAWERLVTNEETVQTLFSPPDNCQIPPREVRAQREVVVPPHKKTYYDKYCPRPKGLK